MENFDLYIRDIAASLKSIAGKEETTTDLTNVVSKLDSIATELGNITTKLNAIDGHLNPIYTADYVAPTSGTEE